MGEPTRESIFRPYAIIYKKFVHELFITNIVFEVISVYTKPLPEKQNSTFRSDTARAPVQYPEGPQHATSRIISTSSEIQSIFIGGHFPRNSKTP